MTAAVKGNTAVRLHDHIKELRMRLFIVALVFVFFSTAAYVFRDEIIHVLLMPIGDERLSYLTPGGGFSFIFKVIMWVGIAGALPFLLLSIYRFISPALPFTAQRRSVTILAGSVLLFVAGAAFGYFYAIPGAMHFLLTFAEDYVSPMLTADSYLNFVLVYTIGLGVLFQIPLIMMIINWISPLRPQKLLSIERYVIVGAFVVAAVITPTPDAVNQTIIATPIVAMYQVGFFAVLFSSKRQKSPRANHVSPSVVTTASQLTDKRSTTNTVSTTARQTRRSSLVVPGRDAQISLSRSVDGISRPSRQQTMTELS